MKKRIKITENIKKSTGRNTKLRLFCAGISLLLVMTATACGTDKNDNKDTEDKKADKKTEKDVGASKQKELEKYYKLLVSFVEDKLECSEITDNSNEYKYTLNDSSVINGIDSFDSDINYVYGYQLADLNNDDKPELLLKISGEVENYETIAYEDDGEIKLSDAIHIDNQQSTMLEEQADAAAIYKSADGKKTKVIVSGAEGSGAENFMFIKELDDNFKETELFSMISGDSNSGFKVDGEDVSEEDFNNKLKEFTDSYKLEKAYSFLNMTDDFATVLDVVLHGEDNAEVDVKEWKTAYANKLMEIKNGNNEQCTFALRCIDDDDVPELLVAVGDSDDTTVDIYTYYMEKVVCLGSFGAYAGISVSNNGMINSSFVGHREANAHYYKIEKGSAVPVLNMGEYEQLEMVDEATYDMKMNIQFYINGNRVEESEYNAKFDEINAGDFEEIYMPDDGTEISKSNIEQVFNEFTGNASSGNAEKNNKNSSSDSSGHAESATTAPTQTPVYNGSNKLTISSAESSSTLSDQQGNNYSASNVFDGNTSTAWAEGSSSDGTGEFIKVNLGSKQVVTMIAMVNGYAKSDDLYHKNCRVKKADLSFSDGTTQIVEFSDNTSSIQKVNITPVETDFVKVTIKEVYSGNSYSDLCISEIELYQ